MSCVLCLGSAKLSRSSATSIFIRTCHDVRSTASPQTCWGNWFIWKCRAHTINGVNSHVLGQLMHDIWQLLDHLMIRVVPLMWRMSLLASPVARTKGPACSGLHSQRIVELCQGVPCQKFWKPCSLPKCGSCRTFAFDVAAHQVSFHVV